MKVPTVNPPNRQNDLPQEQIKTEREIRFQVVDRIKERLPDLAEEEVAKDVAEAIAAVRTKQ